MVVCIFGGVLFFTGCNLDQESISSDSKKIFIEQRIVDMVQEVTTDTILQKQMQEELQFLVDTNAAEIETIRIKYDYFMNDFNYWFNGDQGTSRSWVKYSMEDMKYLSQFSDDVVKLVNKITWQPRWRNELLEEIQFMVNAMGIAVESIDYNKVSREYIINEYYAIVRSEIQDIMLACNQYADSCFQTIQERMWYIFNKKSPDEMLAVTTVKTNEQIKNDAIDYYGKLLSINDFPFEYILPTKYIEDIQQNGTVSWAIWTRPDIALVPLIFDKNGILYTAKRYNLTLEYIHKNQNRQYNDFSENDYIVDNFTDSDYTDLNTFRRITNLPEAISDYAMPLNNDKGEVIWFFDPYVKFFETREEQLKNADQKLESSI